MKAILDTEMPSGVKKDGRRWLLLMILLLLLIGICNCPGRYRREGGMGTGHGSEVSTSGPEKKGLVAGKIGSDAENQGSDVEKQGSDAGKKESDTGRKGEDEGKERPGTGKKKANAEKQGSDVEKLGSDAGKKGSEAGRKREDEGKERPGTEKKKLNGGKKETIVNRASGLRVAGVGQKEPGMEKNIGEKPGDDPRKQDRQKGQDGKDIPGVKKNAEEQKDPDRKKTPEGNKTPDSKKKQDTKKAPDGKKTPERDSTERGWTAGLGINQFFTIGGQEKSNYNSSGTTGGLSDYIPVPVIRYYFNPKLFVQLEAQFNAPQYTKKDFVVSHPPLDTTSPVLYHQTSVQIKKLFYLNLPLSIHYSPFPDFYIGTGLQFSRLSNGIGLFENNSFTPGSTDTLKSARTQSFRGDTIYRHIKTQEFRLLLDLSYNYKKFVLGLRYNRALSNFINIRISATQIAQSRNSSLQLYLRYNFWDNRKKRR